MSIETEYEKLIRERDEHAKRMHEVEAKLKELRNQQADTVLSEIKNKVAEYSFTPEQIFGNAYKASAGLKGSKSEVKVKKVPGAKVVKYKNGNGLTWSGGRGPKPKWVVEILAANGDIEQYRVKDEMPYLELKD